jgi:hypothetical protein
MNTVVKSSTDDRCAVNLDGSLKDLSDTEPEFSPAQKCSAIPLISLPSTSPASFAPATLTQKQTWSTPLLVYTVQTNFENLLESLS